MRTTGCTTEKVTAAQGRSGFLPVLEKPAAQERSTACLETLVRRCRMSASAGFSSAIWKNIKEIPPIVRYIITAEPARAIPVRGCVTDDAAVKKRRSVR